MSQQSNIAVQPDKENMFGSTARFRGGGRDSRQYSPPTNQTVQSPASKSAAGRFYAEPLTFFDIAGLII
jgi:hypothetical protein